MQCGCDCGGCVEAGEMMEANTHNYETEGDTVKRTMVCPECREPIWDVPRGHKLARCWNAEGHAHGSDLAFDTVDRDDIWEGGGDD